MRRSGWVAVVAVLVLGGGCGSTQSSATAADRRQLTESESSTNQLLALINERLQVMALEARARWNAKLPVDDAAREAELVAGMRGRALAHGLSPDWAEAFFRAQIEAGKDVQRQLIDRWTAAAAPLFASAPDLRVDIRPRIEALNQAILDALGEVTPLLGQGPVQSLLRERGAARLASQNVTPEIAARALAPLLREP